MTNLSSSCCGVNGDRGVGGSEKVTVVMGVLIGVGAGLVSNMEVMLVGVGAVMGADVGVRVVSVVGVGVGAGLGADVGVRVVSVAGVGAGALEGVVVGARVAEVLVVLLMGVGAEEGAGVVGTVVMGDGAYVGEKAILVLLFVMGFGAGVAAEVGEGVGPKVLMVLKVEDLEVAVVVVVRRRRKERRYLSIKRVS
ncbi:hypothetical protein OIU74_000682 [Salix koriyanagi]|uniref:Uncharacterized protein n=1 Tax=Salix koriyanagi TaxID=2511006 RepID=A0A9Q1AMJ8_9ROSI|nr:hypothetical protein OIU74_000682 [Salix koriyanagi]